MMNKKIFAAFGLGLILASCGENSAAYKTLKSSYDSLELVSRSYQADLLETDSLVSSVLTNIEEIQNLELLINRSGKGDFKPTEKERVRDNVALIEEKLKASNSAIEELNRKIEANGKENKSLRRTITLLRKQIAEQSERLKLLAEELERKNYAIGVLDSTVISLSHNVEDLNRANARQAEYLAGQERELNTVRFCIGNSSDLKDMGILKGNRITLDQAKQDYFQTVDLRDLDQVPLMSKRAKLLTPHPESSYTLIPDGQKLLTLNIKDKQAFWSSSKILVIQVD